MTLTQHALLYLGMMAGTFVIAWILLWEARYYRRKPRNKWWNKDLW